MSKAKNRTRARVEGPFRNQPDGKRMLCPVAGCGKTFLSQPNQPPLCPECTIFLNKLGWFLPRMQVGPAETKGGLVLPGQPGFGVVPEEVIKKEVERGR
ncbi:hypothetical protein ES703_40622 [subsurface metagenome]